MLTALFLTLTLAGSEDPASTALAGSKDPASTLRVAGSYGGRVFRPGEAPQPKTIAAILIHGNQIVTDEEVLKIAAIAVGEPYTEKTLDEVTRRLEASRKFKSVKVEERYASIDDFSKIAVVINA